MVLDSNTSRDAGCGRRIVVCDVSSPAGVVGADVGAGCVPVADNDDDPTFIPLLNALKFMIALLSSIDSRTFVNEGIWSLYFLPRESR